MSSRAIALALLLFALPARAYEFQITAETLGQGYQLRAADDTLVNRRRVTQYLSLEIFNLGLTDSLGRSLDHDQFMVSMALRFDADLGDFPTTRELSGRTPESELRTDRLDLLWAYVGARRLAGFLDARLGRQIVVDLFDYRSYDGLSFEAHTPLYLAIEGWGGLAVTGAGAFDSPLYRVDGSALGGNPIGSLAARQEDALQPTFGAALKLDGVRDVQSRLSYVRTSSVTGSPQSGEPGSGVVEERLAWTARARLLSGRIVPWFGFRYDLLGGRLDELQAGIRVQLGRRHGLQAEYVYSAPTFDGDSIWNVFGSSAFNDTRLTYDLTFGRLRAYLRGFGRFFGAETTSSDGADPGRAGVATGLSGGGSVGARVDLERGWLRLDGYYENGYGGLKAGCDFAGRLRLVGDPLDGLFLEGRLSYLHFQDSLQPLEHADSFGAQAGLRYAFIRGLTVHALVEEDVNRYYTSQFRALAQLDVAFSLGPRGRGLSRPAGAAF